MSNLVLNWFSASLYKVCYSVFYVGMMSEEIETSWDVR